MCIRDRFSALHYGLFGIPVCDPESNEKRFVGKWLSLIHISRAHETDSYLVCRLLLVEQSADPILFDSDPIMVEFQRGVNGLYQDTGLVYLNER